jgi:hypothetical protein
MTILHEVLRYRNKYFLETGTDQGDIAEKVEQSGFFDSILLIRYDKDIYEHCKRRFESTPSITCYYLQNPTELLFIIKDIANPITFYLNHKNLLTELHQIKLQVAQNHTLILNAQHAPLEIILRGVREINHEYKIKLFSDSKHLLATTFEQPPFCVQKYLKSLSIPGLDPSIPTFPPGVGDILRGAISMLIFCKKYNYKFYIDRSCHPFWDYFKPSEYLVNFKLNDDTKYLLPSPAMPGGHDQIHQELEELFKKGDSFYTICTDFYMKENGKIWVGAIDPEFQTIMKKILTPTERLKSLVLDAFTTLGIHPLEHYIVIHLRCGDLCIENSNAYNPEIVSIWANKIREVMYTNAQTKFLLITDSNGFGRALKREITELYYLDSPKVHLGTFAGDSANGLDTTLIEFMLIIYSKMMLTNSRSGFSTIPSVIFGQPYYPIF